MSLTLGEKLREAREDRGFSITEVAEQTRISPLYLESIEHDDYRTLPGGIFNKGFVKSYAKFVGLNEQEALADYSKLLNDTSVAEESDAKAYKPEVLTDDRSGSMIPTVITAVIILGIMTAGVLYLVDYLRRPQTEAPVANTAAKQPVASNSSAPETPAETKPETPSGVPDMASLKVEFRATSQPVKLIATSDGVKADKSVSAGTSVTFEPKESLTLNYNRWNATAVEMTINGEKITLPAVPLSSAERGRIVFTIDKESLGQIWKHKAISTDVPSVPTEANPPANSELPPVTPTATPVVRTTPVPRPSVPTNTAPSPTPKPPANTAPKPTPAKTPPPANKPNN